MSAGPSNVAGARSPADYDPAAVGRGSTGQGEIPRISHSLQTVETVGIEPTSAVA
jgi:hypothetical protein